MKVQAIADAAKMIINCGLDVELKVNDEGIVVRSHEADQVEVVVRDVVKVFGFECKIQRITERHSCLFIK